MWFGLFDSYNWIGDSGGSDKGRVSAVVGSAGAFALSNALDGGGGWF
jgi:hypothetical protein